MRRQTGNASTYWSVPKQPQPKADRGRPQTDDQGAGSDENEGDFEQLGDVSEFGAPTV
jgi:hypothetical protein